MEVSKSERNGEVVGEKVGLATNLKKQAFRTERDRNVELVSDFFLMESVLFHAVA